MRSLLPNGLFLFLFITVITSCQQQLELEALSDEEVDSISIVNNIRQIDSIPNLTDSSREKALVGGSLGDEWKKYFKSCLKSDIDSKASYVSMANTDGPGVLMDSKLGLRGKDIKNILSPEIYKSLIDVSGNTPTCNISENDYKLIGGYFKATLLDLIHINPNAQGIKLDTIVFSMTNYTRVALNGNVLDSLYKKRNSNPDLKNYFDDLSRSKMRLIIKGYVISGFSASINFSKLDTIGLDAGLDSGLIKNISAKLGFKFIKSKNNKITASSTGDFIPLVQYVKLKDIK